MQYEQVWLNWERVGPLACARWPELKEEDVAACGSVDDLAKLITEAHGAEGDSPGLTEQEAKNQIQEFALGIKEEKGDVPAPKEDEPAASSWAEPSSGSGKHSKKHKSNDETSGGGV